MSIDDPDLDDATGGEDPPVEGETHAEYLRRAYGHMKACKRRIDRALALLDTGPLAGGADNIDPVEFGDENDNPQSETRRELIRAYARATKEASAPNV